jgi:hypothetical protein
MLCIPSQCIEYKKTYDEDYTIYKGIPTLKEFKEASHRNFKHVTSNYALLTDSSYLPGENFQKKVIFGNNKITHGGVSPKELSPTIRALPQFKGIASPEIQTKIPFKKTDGTLVSRVLNGFNVYTVVAKKSLWHGTIANGSVKPEYRQWFHDIQQNKISDRPMFLADKQTASIYGVNKDNAVIVCTKIDNIVVPVYQIPGPHGVNIEFRTTKELTLLDLGDVINVRALIEKVHKVFPSNESLMYINPIYNSCGNTGASHKPFVQCDRHQNHAFDIRLANLICNPKMDLGVDGYIYFVDESPGAKSKFHCEIMLCRPSECIEYKSTYQVPDTIYNDVPTFTQLKESRPPYTKTYNKLDRKLMFREAILK